MKKPYTVNEVLGYDYTEVPDYNLALPTREHKIFFPVDFCLLAWPDKLGIPAKFITNVIMEFCKHYNVNMFVFAHDDDAGQNVNVVLCNAKLTIEQFMRELEQNEEYFPGIMMCHSTWKRFTLRGGKVSKFFQRGDNLKGDEGDYEEEE